MKGLKFAVRYIKFYKRQSTAILFSIIISVALMTGISSLVYSGERSNLEKDRKVYGDYHYYIKADSDLIREIRSKKTGQGYRITRLGEFERKKDIQKPYIFSFVYADGEYFSIIGRKLLKGDYPAKPGEIMLDAYTMENRNISDEIGGKVHLDGKEYTLCGVVSNRWATAVGGMEGFISKDTEGESGKHVKSYFPEIDNDPKHLTDPRMMEYFNGICTEKENGGYGIKSNIYGYNPQMLDGLKDYLLEGTIDSSGMEQKNTVILRTLMDGQGYYDGLLIHPGDTITVKVPKSPDVPEEAVKFGDQDWFEEKEFVVSALVKRAMATNPYFIGKDGLDLIMTNAQMTENFGITDYNMISINQEKEDSGEIVQGIKEIISHIPRCLIKDYRAEIKVQNSYLKQKMVFFYGIALILLIISLMHIINSMSHLVLSRRHEFGILREMGITDTGFLKMMLKEGLLYGAYASIVTVVAYIGLEKVLLFLLTHVYLYINPNLRVNIWVIAGIVFLNLMISVGAVFIPVNKVLSDSIIKEINRE